MSICLFAGQSVCQPCCICLFARLSVFLSVSLGTHLSACLLKCLFFCQPWCLSVYLSIHSWWLSVCLLDSPSVRLVVSICLLACLYVCPSALAFVCMFARPSFYLSALVFVCLFVSLFFYLFARETMKYYNCCVKLNVFLNTVHTYLFLCKLASVCYLPACLSKF